MKAIKRKILAVGGSNILVIPANYARALDMCRGQEVDITMEEKKQKILEFNSNL